MLETEKRNPNSMHIDTATTSEMLKIIQQENYNAVKAVDDALVQIEKVVDVVSDSFLKGGRLFYIGAGTSGRLGVLDASECPPTFGVSPEQVVGIIAGGEYCLTHASEGKEDNAQDGQNDLKAHNISDKDVVIGISAAGGAAYVIGALEYANKIGAATVSFSCNGDTPMEKVAKYSIVTNTGAEVIAGSTRLKCGTAQKLVLNMITTCAMIKTGKVYENLMINVKPANKKLRERIIRIVKEIKNCDDATAVKLLEGADWNIREVVSK